MRKKIERLPVWLLMIIGFVLVALVGYIDFLTGDYSMLIFYAIPVALIAWTVGRLGAVAISTAAGAARYFSDSMSYSGTNVRYWNSLQDMLFLLMVGILIALVREQMANDQKKQDR